MKSALSQMLGLSNKGGLSSVEWTNKIKTSMITQCQAEEQDAGGRNVSGSRHCRHGVYNENNIVETLPITIY